MLLEFYLKMVAQKYMNPEGLSIANIKMKYSLAHESSTRPTI